MANWDTLKSAIAGIIKTNGNQEITGQLLQNVLNNIVSSVGENATFAGIASLDTNPGAPDGPVFYLTATAGTYPNFNGIEVRNGEAVILLWNNNTWSKKVTGFVTQEKFLQLGSEVGVIKQVLKTTTRLFTKNEIPQGSTIRYYSLVKSRGISYLRVFDKNEVGIRSFCEVYKALDEDAEFKGEYVLPENYEYVSYYIFAGEVEVQIEASTSNKCLNEFVNKLDEKVKNIDSTLNQVLKKIDSVKVVDEQVSETAKWAFKKELSNQIVYARVLTDRRVNNAEVFSGTNSLGITLSSNFQRCDLSNVDSFQVYLSLDGAGSVTLEYIEESELIKWIMEDKFMFQYEWVSSENAVMGFISILTGRKGYARITSEHPITNSTVFDGSKNMGFSIPKNGDWVYLDCSKYEKFRIYLSSTQETKVILDFVEDTSFSELIDEKINAVKKEVAELDRNSYTTKIIVEGLKREYSSTYTNSRPFSFDLSDVIIDNGVIPSYINIEYSSENTKVQGLFVEAKTVKKGAFASLYNSELISTEGNVYHYRFNLPSVDSLLSDVDDSILKYKVTCQISGKATTENPHIITLFDVTAKLFFKQGAQLIEKELEKVNDKVKGNENSVNYEWRGYTNMKKVTVKKDGSGDFTTIQDAINSINDASPLNQYDVQVYDDFIISDLKELYKLGGYKNTEDNPSSSVALFFMKDWVHVRGMGRQIKLSIESPNDLLTASFPNIQVIYPCGNNILDNFYVSIKGGRYAIHHESGGTKNSQDYHATTIFRNIVAEHFGNKSYPNSDWGSTYAQANGTTSGTNWIYENCKWISHETYPYYAHKNSDFDEPCHITFINCSMITFAAKNIREISQGCYFGDIGSNVHSDTTIIGCNFVGFSSFSYGNVRGLETIRIGDDIRLGGLNLHGHSNTKMVVNINNKSTLIFQSKNNGSISVVGGTAYDLLWGETFRTYPSSENYPCVVVGIRKIYDRNVSSWGQNATNVYSLAYRLGNCASSPKTLVLNIDGVDVTITFNKNYMTSDGSGYSVYTEPYMKNSSIINEINSFLSAYSARCDVTGNTEYKSYEDCEELGYNKTTDVIPSGKFLVRDYSNGTYAWRLAKSSDTKIEGYSGERISQGNCGRIILTKKVLIPIYSNSNIGEKYTINDNSALEITSDNDKVRFVSVDGSVVEQI